jgi:hypothetical protein
MLIQVAGRAQRRRVQEGAAQYEVTSATTINLNSATGDLVPVIGSSTITTIILAPGKQRTVLFTGAALLTYSASLILPGSANIRTTTGDHAVFRGYGNGIVRCESYTRVAGPISQTLLTPVSLSGSTGQDFTIPSGCKSCTVIFAGVSGSSTGINYIQLGDAGGVEGTGYQSAVNQMANAGATSSINGTTAFFLQPAATAANIIHGRVQLTLLSSSSNTWAASGVTANQDAAAGCIVAGYKAVSQELTTVRFAITSGTYDAGEVNVLYEAV